MVVAATLGCVTIGVPARADTIDGSFDGAGRIEAGTVFDLTVSGRGGVPATGVDSVALNVTVTNPWDAGYLTVWPTGQPRPTASNLNFVRAQTVPNMVVVPVGANGQVSLYLSGGSADVVVDVLGWFPTGGEFHGLTPARLLDSRADGVTSDGAMQATGPLSGGSTFDLPVLGRGGVPASGVGSVVVNVTLTGPTMATYLTVWPTGAPRPTASNLNVAAGETRPNLVVVPVGADGRISLFLYTGSADVVVDVLGWFPTGAAFTGVAPARLMDTRSDGVTVDGSMRAGGVLRAGVAVDLPVLGRGGVPVAGVTAVALNVTVTNPSHAAYVTVWPTGQPRPTTSNLNVVRGQTAPNMVMVPLGADGEVSLFLSRGTADVVVDVLGYATGSTSFRGVTPARLLETRGEWTSYPMPAGSEPGSIAFDGTSLWVASRNDGGLLRVDPASGLTERVAMPDLRDTPQVVMFDGRYVWAAGRYSEAIARFDPTNGRFSVFPARAAAPKYMAFGGDHLWLTDWDRSVLTRVDRRTGAQREFAIPFDPGSVGQPVALGRWLWFPVFDPGPGGVRQIGGLDMVTGEVTQFEVPGLASWAMTTDGALLWAMIIDRSGQLATALIDPTTGVVVRPSPLGATQIFLTRQLLYDGEYVWVASDFFSQIARVNRETGDVKLFAPFVDPSASDGLPWPFAPYAITTDGTYLWTANLSDSVSRVPRHL